MVAMERDEPLRGKAYKGPLIGQIKIRREGGSRGGPQLTIGLPRVALAGRTEPLRKVYLVAVTRLDIILDARKGVLVLPFGEVGYKGIPQLKVPGLIDHGLAQQGEQVSPPGGRDPGLGNQHSSLQQMILDNAPVIGTQMYSGR